MSKKRPMATERKKTFQEMTVREKIEHIWEYYKLAVFGIIAGVALIIYIIMKILNPDPDMILGVTLVNSYSRMTGESENIFEQYLLDNGYNPEEETISVNESLYISEGGMGQSDMASLQALMAWTSVGEIDILAGDENVMNMLGNSGGLLEMEEVLTPAQMEQYGDRLYTTKDPETGQEYVCALKLPEGNLLNKAGYYNGDVWVGIPSTSKRQELAIKIFNYILGE